MNIGTNSSPDRIMGLQAGALQAIRAVRLTFWLQAQPLNHWAAMPEPGISRAMLKFCGKDEEARQKPCMSAV
jgi:hypothetical protein